MSDRNYIVIRVYPGEGYEDVHPGIVLEDFLANPEAFEVELEIEGRDDT